MQGWCTTSIDGFHSRDPPNERIGSKHYGGDRTNGRSQVAFFFIKGNGSNNNKERGVYGHETLCD